MSLKDLQKWWFHQFSMRTNLLIKYRSQQQVSKRHKCWYCHMTSDSKPSNFRYSTFKKTKQETYPKQTKPIHLHIYYTCSSIPKTCQALQRNELDTVGFFFPSNCTNSKPWTGWIFLVYLWYRSKYSSHECIKKQLILFISKDMKSKSLQTWEYDRKYIQASKQISLSSNPKCHKQFPKEKNKLISIWSSIFPLAKTMNIYTYLIIIANY